ncbi:MAG: hypothetical protein WKG00_04495 [Polyangiaceae bacterium]
MRTLGRSAGICGAVLVLSTAATGCADNESEIYIRNVVAPDESCVYTAAQDGISYLSGLLDGAVRFEYSATLLVGNQTVSRGDSDSLRTETSSVNIYEYDVRVLNAEGAVFEGAAFTAPTAGFINAKVGEEDGFGVVGVVLIDGATGQALGQAAGGAPQQVVSEVVVRGRTLGGNEVESRPFPFPISICAGCSVIFPIGVATPDNACGADPEEAPEGLGCTPGQDSSGVPCYQCRNSNPGVCNPPL